MNLIYAIDFGSYDSIIYAGSYNNIRQHHSGILFKEKERIFNDYSKKLCLSFPYSFTLNVKDLFGQSYEYCKKLEKYHKPHEIVKCESDNNMIMLTFDNPKAQYSIDQLIAMELKNLKECIVNHYKNNNIPTTATKRNKRSKDKKDKKEKEKEKEDDDNNNISISCCFAFPSYFDYKTISKFKLLCKIYKMNIEFYLPEYICPCISYGYNHFYCKSDEYEEDCLFIDIGYVSTQTTICHLKNGELEVKYTNYNKEIGVRKLDLYLYEILCKIIFDKYGKDFYNDNEQYNRLMDAVNEMKDGASFNGGEIFIIIDRLISGEEIEISIPINYFNHKVEESDFMKELLNELLQSVVLYIKTNKTIIKPLKLVFCGQTTRIPIITTLIKEYLTNKGVEFDHMKYEIDCKNSLSEGLLYYNEILHGEWKYNIIYNENFQENNFNNNNNNNPTTSLSLLEEEDIIGGDNNENINYNYLYTIQLIEKDLNDQDKLSNEIKKLRNLIESTVYEREREIDKINDEDSQKEMKEYLENALKWLKENKYHGMKELKMKLDEMEDKWYSNAIPYISLKRSRENDDENDDKSISSDEEKDYKKKNKDDSKRLKIIWFSKNK